MRNSIMMYIHLPERPKLEVLHCVEVKRDKVAFSKFERLYKPEFSLLQFFLECDREIVCNEKVYSFKDGHIMYSSPSMPYYVRRPKCVTHALNIVFETPIVKVDENQNSDEGLSFPIIMDVMHDAEIMQQFKSIMFHHLEGGRIEGLLSDSLLMTLLISLAKYYKSNKDIAMLKAKNYLHSHIRENYNEKELLKVTKLSKSVFYSRFRKHFNQTPRAYHERLRMKQAMALLKVEPLITVSDVSHMLGFCDPYYFSNVFYKFTKCRPKEYRDRKK